MFIRITGAVDGKKLGTQADASSCTYLCVVLLARPYLSHAAFGERGKRYDADAAARQLALFGHCDRGESGVLGVDIEPLTRKSLFWPERS